MLPPSLLPHLRWDLMAAPSAVRWPRVLTPTYLAYLIRRQKNPLSALHLFLSCPSLFPSYRHNSQVFASLSSLLLSSSSLSPLLPSLLLPSCGPHASSEIRRPSISLTGWACDTVAPFPSQSTGEAPPGKTPDSTEPRVPSVGLYGNLTNALRWPHVSVTLSELDSPPLPDSLIANVISCLPLHLSFPLFLSLPTSTCVAWTQSFHCILSKLLSNGEPESAIKIFLQFSRHSEVQIGSETLDMFIAYLGGIRRPDLGLELYREYYNLCCFPGQKTCQILLKGLIEVGMLDEAMHLLYSMMREYNIDAIVVSCRTLIDELCANGRAKEGEMVLKKVLNKIRRRTGRVRSFLRVPIDLAGKSLEEVRETVDVALSVSGARSVAAYEVMTGDLFEERRFQAAQKVFDEMISKGFQPSVKIFEAKIAALCREGMINDALQVLEQEMREKDIAPTVTMFNLLIDGLCKSSQSMRAVGYLKIMNQWPSCMAGKETFEILIDGLYAEKQYVKAASVLDKMLKRGHRPKDGAFAYVVHGLCEAAGTSYEAMVWLEEMVAHGVVPDGSLWGSLVSLVCRNVSGSCYHLSDLDQGPHKVSFNIPKEKAQEVITPLYASLTQRGLDVKIIYSFGLALDVLPKEAGKGQALAYLLKKFGSIGKPPKNTLVCGDSGNDAEMFTVEGVYGVMVSNSTEELLEWYEQNAKSNHKIVHATERCASGIIQAISHFQLGHSTSPRDIKPSFLNEDNRKPAFMVNFYLLYECWRRAEAEKSEAIIQYLKSITHSTGVIVDPSGSENSIHQSIDALESCHGDKSGRPFMVWLDKVHVSAIGLDSWLVKFDKWELNGHFFEGQTCRCCVTTVLLNSKMETPSGFSIMHMHQTWLEEYRTEDQQTWIF